jgi:hypothetical protein
VDYLSESNLEALIDVVRRGGTDLPVSVSYATDSFSPAALNAVPGVDYQSQSNVLAFAPGETKRTITVTLLDDTLAEPNKNFYLRLENATGGAVLRWPTQARVVILDDEPGWGLPAATQAPGTWERG